MFARSSRASSSSGWSTRAAADWQACATSGERKALIARDDVVSEQGNAYWLYLGDWS